MKKKKKKPGHLGFPERREKETNERERQNVLFVLESWERKRGREIRDGA